MNCPSCGVDVEAYERERARKKTEEKKGREKENEFERICGHTLRSIRKRRARISGITAGIIMTMVIGSFLLYPLPGDAWFWEGLKTASWHETFPIILALLVSLFVGTYSGIASALFVSIDVGKQERELRKSFGL